MWQVGPNHPEFLAALGGAHGYGGRVEAFYDGEKIDEIEFESGSVKVTARNRERRTISDLVVPQRLWPTLPGDPLSPYGVWLRALVAVTAAATVFDEIPVFAGKLLKVGWERWSNRVEVEARDPMWQVNREPFEFPRPAPAGKLIVATILQLLREVVPEASLTDLTGSQATVPPVTSWDARPGSRGKAIDELAAAIGAEVFARPTVVWPYGDFVIRPVPSLADPVAWTIPDGLASIVTGDRMSQAGDTVVNRWIVSSERTDAPPIWEPVTDDDPTSPTRYGGPMGHLTDFWSSPLIFSPAQARTAGLAKLNRSIGAARTRKLRVVANPALEAGDVLAVSVDADPLELHIADDFGVPLTHDPASMDIDTRSTGGTE